MRRRADEEMPRTPEELFDDARALGAEDELEDEDTEGELLPDAEDDLILDGPLEVTDDELLGESEYEIRASGQDRYPVVAGANRRLGVHEEQDISVDPEELGRRALEEATQDFHPRTEDDGLPEAEWPGPRWGEREIVELIPSTEEREADRLVSDFSDGDESEERISNSASHELERRRRPRQRKGR